jgi:2',3'-cyclic-nucleotide 2'-phosphodiesterase (5'-nucleotidase family)
VEQSQNRRAVTIEPPDRRQFLRLLGSAVTACTLPGWLRAADHPDLVRISLLHTTDLHGHVLPTIDYDGHRDLGGMARCVTQIRRWRAENPNSLLIDVGDVYQGTQFALSDQGRMMIELFNLLRYDAWVVGNHEFDWGIDAFLQAVDKSSMPVLAANTLLEGKAAGDFGEARHPFAKIQPFLCKEIAGIKIAIIGLTTPGMPFWFPPRFIAGMEFQNPVEPVRRAMRRVTSLGANAIVLAGHMGLKDRTGGDDFANQVMTLTSEFPETAVFIAGHTHQDIPSRLANNVLVSQADHFGIHVGRVDLLFDRNSRRLLHQEARTELMDHRIPPDPVVLGRAQPQLDRAATVLAQPVGELADTLRVKAPPGEPCEVVRLIAAAITETLEEHHVVIDGVFHGLFEQQHAFLKGLKTVDDIWTILPYENFLVTAELGPIELRVMMEEVLQSRETRALSGFLFSVTGEGGNQRLTNLRLTDGRPLDPSRRYRIAMNTFDASSGGHRFMKLRQMLARPEARLTFHPIQSRDALIAYFRRHNVVRRTSLGQFLRPAA